MVKDTNITIRTSDNTYRFYNFQNGWRNVILMRAKDYHKTFIDTKIFFLERIF